METITPTKPQISESTMKEIAAFFARTSVPRIIAEMQKEKQKKEGGYEKIQSSHQNDGRKCPLSRIPIRS